MDDPEYLDAGLPRTHRHEQTFPVGNQLDSPHHRRPSCIRRSVPSPTPYQGKEINHDFTPEKAAPPTFEVFNFKEMVSH